MGRTGEGFEQVNLIINYLQNFMSQIIDIILLGQYLYLLYIFYIEENSKKQKVKNTLYLNTYLDKIYVITQICKTSLT